MIERWYSNLLMVKHMTKGQNHASTRVNLGSTKPKASRSMGTTSLGISNHQSKKRIEKLPNMATTHKKNPTKGKDKYC